MGKNKQKRKIKDPKHAHIKTKKDKIIPYFNRNTGHVHNTSNREPLSSSFKALVEYRKSTELPNITIKTIFDNTEEE